MKLIASSKMTKIILQFNFFPPHFTTIFTTIMEKAKNNQMTDFHVFGFFPFIFTRHTATEREWTIFVESNKNFDCIELFCLWNWFDVNVITIFSRHFSLISRLMSSSFSSKMEMNRKWKLVLSTTSKSPRENRKICFHFELKSYQWKTENSRFLYRFQYFKILGTVSTTSI